MSARMSTMVSESAGTVPRPHLELSSEDRQLVWAGATLLLDVTDSYATDVSAFVAEKVALPRDPEMMVALQAHAAADAREVLVTLRAGMDPTAHETPAEALAHARYLRQRGVGLGTLIDVYRYGFAMFRELAKVELAASAGDPAQVARLSATFDAYAFPFVATTLQRLAYEFGSADGWTPTAADPVLSDPECLDRAHQLRARQLAQGAWIAASPDRARARSQAKDALDAFAEKLEAGIEGLGLDRRLSRAATSVTITLADETDLSVALLLDRSPVEVVDGVADTEARMWIPSVDLERLLSPDFLLPMAIAKGRVAIDGPIRKFLRVIPILRTIQALDGDGGAHVRGAEEFIR